MTSINQSSAASSLPPINPPEQTPWFLRRLGFFMWNTFQRGIQKGTEPLNKEDIPPVEACENPLTIIQSQGIPPVPIWKAFMSFFCNRSSKINYMNDIPITSSSTIDEHHTSNNVTNQGGLTKLLASCRTMTPSSLIKWFIKLDYQYFLLSGIGFLLLLIGQILIPFFVQNLLYILENSNTYTLNQYTNQGILFIIAMIICILCQFVGGALGWLPACQIDYRSEIVLTALTGLKGILLSSKVRDTGEEQYIFSKYATIFTDNSLFGNLHFDTWVASTFLIVGLINLVYLLGYAGLFAFIIQILCTIFAFRTRSYIRKMDRQTNVYSQVRLRMLGESLGYMKELRSIGWDKWSYQRLEYIRSKEIEILQRSSLLKVIVDVLFALMEIATLITAFLGYALLYPNHPLSATAAFASITWIYALSQPMKGIPAFIQALMDTSVSVKAIKDNLDKTEVSLSKIHDQWKVSNNSTNNDDNWGLLSTSTSKTLKPASSAAFDQVARELQKLLNDAAKRIDDDIIANSTNNNTTPNNNKNKHTYKQSLNKNKYLDDSFAVTVQDAEEKDLLAFSSLDSLAITTISNQELTIDTLSSATGTYQPISFDNIASSTSTSDSNSNVSLSNGSTGSIRIRMDEVSLGVESKPTNIVRLYDLSFNCPSNSLTVCIGKTGSGKSLLLKSLIGDVDILSGTIDVIGKVAYIGHDPWIQRLSIRDNICFHSSYQPIRYNEIIKACGLDIDLPTFIDNDQTILGDDGNNLSGGQRMRIALARAIYTDADVYVFDDIFSALDNQVAEQIWNEVIIRLLLRNGQKTIILATQSLHFLSRPEIYQILLLDKEMVATTSKSPSSTASNWHYSHSLQDTVPNRIIVRGRYTDILNNPKATFLHESLKTNNDNTQTTSVSSTMNNDDIDNTKPASTSSINNNPILDKQTIPSWTSIRYYIQAIGWLRGSLLLIFYIASQSINIFQSWWLKLWAEQSSTTNNLSAAQVYSGIGIGYAILITFRMITLAISLTYAGKVLHDRAIYNIFNAPLSFFVENQSGTIYSRFEGDIKHIDLFIRPNVSYGANALFTLIGSIVVIMITSPWVLLWIVFISIFFVKLSKIYRKSVMKVRSIEAAARSTVTTYWKEIESNNGASFIRALGPQSVAFAVFRLLQRMEIVMQTHIASKSGSSFALTLFALFGNTISIAASIAAFAFGYGNHAVLSVAAAGLLLSYSYSFPASIYALVVELGYLEQSSVSIQRIVDYVLLENENTIQNQFFKNKRENSIGSLHSLPAPNSDSPIHVKFTGVGLRYNHQNVFAPWALRNVSMEIPRGKKIAIVGRTGSGKSSIFNCLLRLYPYEEGTILLNNININQYTDVHELRKQIAVITQNPVIIQGTLRENLFGPYLPFSYCTEQLYTNTVSTTSSISSASPLTSKTIPTLLNGRNQPFDDNGIMRFIKELFPILYTKFQTLSHGLDTYITNETFSKGEKALLNLARLLLAQYLMEHTPLYRSLILLDEPNADIDYECNQLFHKIILQQCKETIIAICHRKEYLPLFDYIIVMDNGAVQHMITSEQYVNIMREQS